jgi:hypothetical protein
MTKIQMTKTETKSPHRLAVFVWNFENLNFEFVSDFGFRISDLLYTYSSDIPGW